MNKLFSVIFMSLMLSAVQNAIGCENYHTGHIDALVLALKISHEGADKVKSEIDKHSFTQWTFHKPTDEGCMNGLTCGTNYSPFIIECPQLQRDESSQLSREIYTRIDQKTPFSSKNELYNRYIVPLAGLIVDHCTYVRAKDSSVCVYTYFFDKAALVALFEKLTKQ